MKQIRSICAIAALLLLTNCEKEAGTAVVDCFPDAVTARQIISKVAVANRINGQAILLNRAPLTVV